MLFVGDVLVAKLRKLQVVDDLAQQEQEISQYLYHRYL